MELDNESYVVFAQHRNLLLHPINGSDIDDCWATCQVSMRSSNRAQHIIDVRICYKQFHC